MASNYREFCIYCGKAIQPGSRHCPYCGKKLIDEPQDAAFGKQSTAVPPILPPSEEVKRTLPVALIAGISGALVAVIICGFLFLRGAGGGRESVIPTADPAAEGGQAEEAAAGPDAAAADSASGDSAAAETEPVQEESPAAEEAAAPAEDGTGAVDMSLVPAGAMEYGGNYYYVFSSDGVRSYAAAKQDCERQGGHLAVITSEDLNSRLYQYCLDSGYETAFFGYNDEQIEGNWVWVTEKQPYYTNWGRTEPNADSVRENGALFSTSERNGTWNDSAFGYETSAYICQWGDNGVEDEQAPREIPEDALEYDGHYYYIYEDGVSRWSEAQQWCKSRGGDLAVIGDAGENEALYDYMVREGYEYAFFGYSDAETEGVWKWVSGKTSAFTDWGTDRHGTLEPDDDGTTGQDHAAMSIQMFDGHWDDRKFTSSSPYICEWEPER